MKIKEIINIVGGELLSGSFEAEVNGISQNSNSILKGQTFIAIKGDQSDGHKYIDDAIKNGAEVCIVSDNTIKSDKATILWVEDTERALYEIIDYKLSIMDVKKIAVTGSVGKTSTKELLSTMFDTNVKVFKTFKNYNTKRGIALSISEMSLDTEVLIVEMGMNDKGQIHESSLMIKPDIAIITNIGSSHIGILGSQEEILKAKMEITDGLAENGILLLNADDAMLRKVINEPEKYIQNKNVRIYTYGIDNEATIKAENIEFIDEGTKFNAKINNQTFKYQTNTFGKHSIYNVLTAIFLAKTFNIPDEDIQTALMKTKITERRMDKFVTISNMMIFDDSYNSSYESTVAAIDVIVNKNYYGRKVAVLGDILELGDFTEEYHRKIGDILVESKFDVVITAGEASKYIIDEINNKNSEIKTYHFENSEEISEVIDNLLMIDDIVLIKASNGMNFNIIAEKLREKQVDPAKLK